MVYSHSFFADGMQQFGIRGVKIPFDPNIFMNYTAKIKKMHLIEKYYQHINSLRY